MAINDHFQSKNANSDELIDLIPDLTPKERYLFDAVTSLNDRFEGMEKKTDEQTELLTKILEQTTATNGKVKDLRRDVDMLDKANKDIEPDIKSVKLVKKVVRTKYFWFTVAGLFLVVLPWISSTFPPKVIVGKVVDWVSGP